MSKRRFFWLKLKDDFFDDKQIKYLRLLPDGDHMVITYLKMQLKSLKTKGILKYDKLLPTCEEELALLLDEDINIVKFTIGALEKIDAIEKLEDDSIYIIAMQELIGTETDSAGRMRRMRNKQKLLASQCDTNVGNRYTDIDKNIEIDKEIEIEIDKEIDKEINIDSKKNKKLTINDVCDCYEKNIARMEITVLNQMIRLIQEGTTPEAIIEAINKATDYNGKSWGYVCTILDNQKKQNYLYMR